MICDQCDEKRILSEVPYDRRKHFLFLLPDMLYWSLKMMILAVSVQLFATSMAVTLYGEVSEAADAAANSRKSAAMEDLMTNSQLD